MGMKIFAVGASLAIVAAMAIALGIYFRVIPVPMSLLGTLARTRQPEFSARYYPQDTAAYTWITLTPGGRQMRYMQDIWGKLNEYPAFADAVDDWKSGFAEESGISFDEDVATWIGPTMSAGVLDVDTDSGLPSAAALIAVRDEEEAADFLAMWTDYVSTKWDMEFEPRAYQEHRTWVSARGRHAYSLTSDWLIYATDDGSLHEILDRIDGRAEESLAESGKFQAARGTLPEPRFASAYLDTERGAEILEAWGSPFGSISPLTGAALRPNENGQWLAFAATWIDRGLATEWVAPAYPAPGLNVADLEDPAALLPADTLGFVAASFDPNIDHWRVALADRRLADVLPGAETGEGIGGMFPGLGGEAGPQLNENASLAEVLDLGLQLAHDKTGIDLETEFFDHLAGTAILAIRDFDISAVREDPSGNAIEAVGMLSYREGSREDLLETMSRVTELAQTRAGVTSETVDVGAELPATAFDLGLLGMLMGPAAGYRPGYVLHDQYLTVGTTPQALRTIVALQNGRGVNLSADAEYQRAVQYLPADRRILGYIDGQRVVSQLNPEDLGLEADEYQLVREGMGVLAFGSAAGEGHSRSVAVLTLFPQ